MFGPGLHPRRLALLIDAAITRCKLDLTGAVVLTEAATGAYVVTPVIAALAGAKGVFAYAHSSRFGSASEATRQTLEVADNLSVSNRIEVITEKTEQITARADIVTNSGHLRPIDSRFIGWMKATAVIPLMYETWEFRPTDVDLEACRARGIRTAGTDERSPSVDVFSYLGIMATKLLLDAGLAVRGNRILCLCDNPFASFIERGLVGAGATVDVVESLRAEEGRGRYDAVLVALEPSGALVFTTAEAAAIARSSPGVVVVQFWGDIDRDCLALHDVPVWPEDAPEAGHMGILPSDVGPEPVVRLQAAGLKVGEMLWRGQSAEVTKLSACRAAGPIECIGSVGG
ncbi:MAG: hypothetical protein IID39_00060 [Planctomycetes bacterium]|nr:hypothetical protein [Planctomycetota bacterium]